MTAPIERTKSMRAYADAYGEPDREVSDRLEQRLESMIAREEAGGGRRLGWRAALVGLALVGALGVGAGIWLASTEGDGVVRATDRSQRIRLSAGTVLLRRGAELGVIHDDGRTIVALRAGSIEVEGTGATMEVLSGPYSVEGTEARFSVTRATGVPIVTVEAGEVRVRGPDLPPAGVTVLPVAP